MKNVARNSIFGFGLAAFFHFIFLGYYVWEYHEMFDSADILVDFAKKFLDGVFPIFCVLFCISFRRVLNDET